MHTTVKRESLPEAGSRSDETLLPNTLGRLTADPGVAFPPEAEAMATTPSDADRLIQSVLTELGWDADAATVAQRVRRLDIGLPCGRQGDDGDMS
jgi:hypothetical protein